MAFGISMHCMPHIAGDPDEISDEAFEAIGELPASWLRSDFYWDHSTDPHANNALFVSRAHARNKRVLCILDWWTYINAWTTVLSDESALRTKLRRILGEVSEADAFELWNEPNIVTGIDPPWAGTYIDGTAESYLDYLRICHDEIRSLCPSALIVCGALGNDIAGASVDPLEWLQTLVDLDGMQYCDRVSLHLYIESRNVDDLVEARAITGKEVWATESGWPSTGAAGYTEADQASKLTTRMNAHAPYAEVVMWYCLTDYATRLSAEDHYGLTYTTFAAKKAHTSYKALNPTTPPLLCQLADPEAISPRRM